MNSPRPTALADRPDGTPVTRPAPSGRRDGHAPAPQGLLLVLDPRCDDLQPFADFRDRWDVHVCTSAAEGLLVAGNTRPDVVVVASDVEDLPVATVVELLDRICGIPVIVATAGEHADQVAAALDAGAVACVARPYRYAQLLALATAVRPARTPTEEPVLRSGSLELFPVAGTVRLRGSLVLMPPQEFRVLEHLMRHEGRVVSQSELWSAVWGRTTPSTSNTVSVHVRRLRRRLGDDPREPGIITTVGRSGYLLQPATG
jgi:DNA-binding response OmpR family regulator